MTPSREQTIWAEATRRLDDHPRFGPLVREVGPVRVPATDDEPFVYLVRAIIYQQLAGAAARTIHGRVIDVLGGVVEPAAFAEAPDDALRGAGLSGGKLRALRDLTRRVLDGELAIGLAELERLDDREIVRRLTTVRGVGPWTAQMFLMFRLHRPDVWPVLDLGVRNGWARLYGLDPAPDARALEPQGEGFRPWRSAVAWYCWRALEVDLPTP